MTGWCISPNSDPMQWFYDPIRLSVFKRCFEIAFGQAAESVQLDLIPHWLGLGKRLGVDFSAIPFRARLADGYIYNFGSCPSNTMPDLPDSGISAVLTPHVPESLLGRTGGIKIPCDISSSANITSDFEKQLAHVVGSRRAGNIRRLARKARTQFQWQVIKGTQLKGKNNEIAELAAVHELNVRKHNHPVNLYSENVIHYLLQSEVAESVRFFLRRSLESGKLVQMCLLYQDEERAVLYSAVQGIDHDAVPPGHNLYVSQHYDLFEFAATNGIGKIYLGRGAELDKSQNGADEFELLYMVFKSASEPIRAWLQDIRNPADTYFQGSLLRLGLDPRS